jgi:hypothetical protein
MNEVTIDPKILAKVTRLAGVKDFPLVVDMFGYPLKTSNRQEFELGIKVSVEAFRNSVSCTPSSKVSTKARRHARELKEALKALSHLLPSADRHIVAVSEVAKALHPLERFTTIKRPGKRAEIFRKRFVENLLHAADKAGGQLGLNRRNGRGSLVEVINLLQPYLPAESQHGLSAPTLRRVKETWLKKQKNRSKNS